jgi:alkylation response protein AidB-like acyl-CoA dehydrogenase
MVGISAILPERRVAGKGGRRSGTARSRSSTLRDMTEAQVRQDVRAWIAEHWDPDQSLVEWRSKLADSGWGNPTWPTEWYGRGLPDSMGPVVAEELRRAGVPAVATGSGMSLAAPTMLNWGSDDLKRRHLRSIVTGEKKWCQLFSEPSNGSDLAGLTTRAVQDGEEWIINGQKVWTTGAHQSDWAILLARTDPDVPKHRGITYFVIDMHQPGIEVRPLVQMNGRASFNEVFLTDARVASGDVVGEVGKGWGIALTTLSYERGLGRSATEPLKGEGRAVREANEELAAQAKTYEWYPQRAGRVDLLSSQLHAGGRGDDAHLRDEVVEVITKDMVSKWGVARAAAARAAGKPPTFEGSLHKLMGTDVARSASRVHGHLAGPGATLDRGEGAAADGLIAEIFVSVPSGSIAGGTDQIQRDILGERALGLPKEPQVDKDIPFREVRTNAARPSAR